MITLKRILFAFSWLIAATILTSCQKWPADAETAKSDSLAIELQASDSSSGPQVQLLLFELSGAATMSEGVLLADDELVGSVYFAPYQTFDDLILSPVKIERKRTDSAPFTDLPKLVPVQDFEGLAADDDIVYLVGSHQAHSSQDRRSDREFLIRAKWDDGKLKFLQKYDDLLANIAKTLTDEGLVVSITDKTISPTINIEGLAINDGNLLVGLREPLLDGNAILMKVDAKDIFSSSPQFALATLALDGAGIRGLHWDVASDRLLVLSGGKDDDGDIDQEIVPGIWEVLPEVPTPKLMHSFTSDQLGAPAGVRRSKPEALSLLPDGRVAVFMDGEATADNRVLYLDL